MSNDELKVALKNMLKTGELYFRLESDMNHVYLSVEVDGEEVARSDIYLSDLKIEEY
jgi:hypothetical protein